MYKDELKKLSTTSDSSISQTIDLFNTRLTPALNSLKSAYQNIFTADGFDLNAVDTSMLADIKSDIETLNQLEGVHINIDTKAFDDFVTVLTDSTTTEQQAKQAFNDLASTIFYAADATNGMTDETRKLVEQLLTSLGVTNASAVAEYDADKAALTTYDLAGATEAEFLAILGEGEAAGLTRQAIYNLTAAEIAFGNNNLNAPQKIEQLKELATAYGDTASSALATAIANDLASGHTDVDSAISDLMSQINSGMKKVNLDLNEQLTGLFPSLTRNYDENGNAILGLSGFVDSVTESIKALVEQEKELAKAKIRENIEQYFDGTDDADGAWKALEGRKKALEQSNKELEELTNTYYGLINSDEKINIGRFHKNIVNAEKTEYLSYIKDNFGEDIADAVKKVTSIRLGMGLSNQSADLVVDFSKLK